MLRARAGRNISREPFLCQRLEFVTLSSYKDSASWMQVYDPVEVQRWFLSSVGGVTMNDWRLFAFGSAFFAALTAVLGKVGVTGIGSNMATFIRTTVVVAVTGIIVSAFSEWEDPRAWKSRSIVFLVFSGLATGLSWLCYYRALQLAPASKVAPIDKLSVVLVIVLAVAFLGEPLSFKVVVGGLLVFAGAIILAL